METDETDFDAFDADDATWPNITSGTVIAVYQNKPYWRRHRRTRFAQKREAKRKFVLTLTKKRSTSPDVTLPNQNRT